MKHDQFLKKKHIPDKFSEALLKKSDLAMKENKIAMKKLKLLNTREYLRILLNT